MPDSPADDALEAQVLDIVRALAAELHPQRRGTSIGLGSSLDRDLGFDSLARSELLLRLAEATRTELPDSLLSSAETPRDLLTGLREAPGRRWDAPVLARSEGATPRAAVEIPVDARTLVDVLVTHARVNPERVHVQLYEGASDAARSITYVELLAGATRVAAGLQQAGLEPGQAVAIMLPTGAAYLETFLAVLLAGGVAVPIYPPERPSQLEDHLRRHGQILDNAQAKLLVAPAEAHPVVRLLRNQAVSLETAVTPDDLALTDPARFVPRPVGPDDVAMLQYTSGSTGQPKGVILTHAQLLANIRALGAAIGAQPTDVFLSWLPLYHDMGLIGAWLGSLYFAMGFVLMPPTAFLGRPSRWLTRLHEHRATITGGPNFAYETCVTRVRDDDIAGIDLSCLRLAVNGSEAVSPSTVRRFCNRFAAFGFRRVAMAPAYGLAEAGVGLTLPPPTRGPLFDRIERDAYERQGEARPAPASEPNALEYISSGQALPGYQLRVVDDSGRELPDRRVGRIEFRGPSATRGYMRNPEATSRLIHGDWLDTGDLGYIVSGDLFITGRVKDLIKRAGRNIYPHEVEEAVGAVSGVRKGCVAAFGTSDPAARTEKLVIVAETPVCDADALAALRAEIDRVAAEVLGFAPDDVALVPIDTVPKTASGKLRRSACRELYDRGEIGTRSPRVAWQVVRLWTSGLLGRRRRRRLADDLYAVWARIVFFALAGFVWPVVAILPTSSARWSVMRGCARLLFRACGIPLTVKGLDNLPSGRCVLVSNHASYLDGVAIAAMLPTMFSFVVKGELEQQFVPRVFLRRIDASFVERFDAQKGIQDARRIIERLDAGQSVLFFAEGTFTRSPGLLPFHTGAFVAAVDARAPVVPIAIRGTRSILRSDESYAHRGAIVVDVGPAVEPEGTGFTASIALRDRVRQSILERVGEPDLAAVLPIVSAPAPARR
jgi:1-acyl-sn-glycerol-3-phosphate acyltransferase